MRLGSRGTCPPSPLWPQRPRLRWRACCSSRSTSSLRVEWRVAPVSGLLGARIVVVRHVTGEGRLILHRDRRRAHPRGGGGCGREAGGCDGGREPDAARVTWHVSTIAALAATTAASVAGLLL